MLYPAELRGLFPFALLAHRPERLHSSVDRPSVQENRCSIRLSYGTAKYFSDLTVRGTIANVPRTVGSTYGISSRFPRAREIIWSRWHLLTVRARRAFRGSPVRNGNTICAAAGATDAATAGRRMRD